MADVPPTRRISKQTARQDYLRRLPLPVLPCAEISVSPIRTSDNSATRPAPSTLDAVRHETNGLKTLWLCETIWTRLEAYADLEIASSCKDDAAIGGRSLFHLSDCPDAPKYPPSTFETGYEEMHMIELSQLRRRQPTLCNIESVQDAVNGQILDVVNSALQMRYKNRAGVLSAGYTYKDSTNEPTPVEDVEASCFYPAWLRSCYKHHKNKGQGTSGYTDRMLFASPSAPNPEKLTLTQVALQEGKPPWVYTSKHFDDIIKGHEQVINERHKFEQFDQGHNGNLLLKQLWGQCADLGPNAGFTTNGDVVMVFFRVQPPPSKDGSTVDSKVHSSRRSTPKSAPQFDSSPFSEDSGFVLSPLMDWTDPRLRTCLIGLSFMTLDEQSWLTRQVKNPDTDQFEAKAVSLRDLLCPVEECTQILQRAQE